MMKFIVEEKNGYVMSINIEYTPTEALVINHAMRRYACDEDVNETDRAIMERMLKVEPIRQEVSEDCISRARVIGMFGGEVEKKYPYFAKTIKKLINALPRVKPIEYIGIEKIDKEKWEKLIGGTE